MKHSRFFATTAVAFSTLLSFYSCTNAKEEKKADETKTDATAVQPVEPAAQAKPANVLIIKHKVANFTKWMSSYESHDSARLAYGLHNYVVSRGAKDSNMVMVALKMDDVNKAKEFAAMPDLKERMKKGGVLGTPTFDYRDVQMLDNSTNASTARVMISHKVKDWDAWKKEFDKHKQARMDAGLTDRALSYSIGDNHMVSIVAVVNDMKKAEAFMSSKDLKDKMTAAGVEGPPTIFFYNVVKSYQ
jgi:hypothetical protein